MSGAGGRKPSRDSSKGGPKGPEPLGQILARVKKDLRLEERHREGAVATAWGRAAGPEVAARTRPVGFRDGVLTVEVDGAALLHRLRGYEAASLLGALRAEPGAAKVRELRFVPGGGGTTAERVE